MNINDEHTNMDINNLIETRYTDLGEGITPLFIWPKVDDGAWYGPNLNWHQGHKEDYFRYVKKYDLVITAGANCGLHTRVYQKKFKQVYAFEPHWLNFYCLVRNCPNENVHKFQAALGSESGFCNIVDYNETNMGAITTSLNINGNIPVMSIDSFGLPACDLIQLDAEGFEPHILEGAKDTIKKYEPVIVVETLDETMKRLLHSLDYKEGIRSCVDWVFYKE